MTGRYFVVVEPDGDSLAFESLAEAKRCEDAWDRDFYRSKPNRIVECIAMPTVRVDTVTIRPGTNWFGVFVNGVRTSEAYKSRAVAANLARDLRRALRKGK